MSTKRAFTPIKKKSTIYCPQCKKGELEKDRRSSAMSALELRRACPNCYTRWRIVFYKVG